MGIPLVFLLFLCPHPHQGFLAGAGALVLRTGSVEAVDKREEELKIYGKLPKDISNNFINNTQEQAKIYFEKKYLEIFRKIAKEIDAQSTIFAFMYMLLMSDCFNRLKLVEKLLPQIEKKIKKKLGISNSTNEWNIFWGKKENACSNVISKLTEAKKEKDYKKTWNAIKFITIEIFELLFHLTAPDAKAKKQKVDIFIDHGKKYENTAFSHDEMNYYESNQHSFEEKHAQSKRVLEKLLDPPAKSIVERQMFRKFVRNHPTFDVPQNFSGITH